MLIVLLLGANRVEMETLISNYLFGKPVGMVLRAMTSSVVFGNPFPRTDSIVLKGSLFDPAVFRYAAINLTYPFDLPPKVTKEENGRKGESDGRELNGRAKRRKKGVEERKKRKTLREVQGKGD